MNDSPLNSARHAYSSRAPRADASPAASGEAIFSRLWCILDVILVVSGNIAILCSNLGLILTWTLVAIDPDAYERPLVKLIAVTGWWVVVRISGDPRIGRIQPRLDGFEEDVR